MRNRFTDTRDNPDTDTHHPLLGDAGEEALIADDTPRQALSDNLFESAQQLANDPTLTEDQAREKLWQQVQANPPAMPPQTLARWHDDKDRRDAAMDDLMFLSQDPNRIGQAPDQITHLWANGMEGNPGAYDRNNPPPPKRSWGQVVGFETDPYADQRQFPLMDGVRADWHDFSGNVGNRLAEQAHQFGFEQAAHQLEADAARDQAAVDALRDQYQYDPNATLAFEAGYYGRELLSKTNFARKAVQFKRNHWGN